MTPINKASAVAETPASFAALYASNDPGVSALGKPWIKRRYWPSGLTVELVELNSRPGGRKQQLTPLSVGAETVGPLQLDIDHVIL
jgi:hypothetical protein